MRPSTDDQITCGGFELAYPPRLKVVGVVVAGLQVVPDSGAQVVGVTGEVVSGVVGNVVSPPVGVVVAGEVAGVAVVGVVSELSLNDSLTYQLPLISTHGIVELSAFPCCAVA
jgi:hypothetical protein